MPLSDYFESMKGATPVEPPVPAAPQIPNQETQRSPYLRTTVPLPLQYTGDTIKQFNVPGLSLFRIAPLPPSGTPAINSAVVSTVTSVVQGAIAATATTDIESIGINEQTGTAYTVQPSDRNTLISMSNNSGGTITLPAGIATAGIAGLSGIGNLDQNVENINIGTSITAGPLTPSVANELALWTVLRDQFNNPPPPSGWSDMTVSVTALFYKQLATTATISPNCPMGSNRTNASVLMSFLFTGSIVNPNITSVTVDGSGNATIVVPNTLVVGTFVSFSGLTVATFLNGAGNFLITAASPTSITVSGVAHVAYGPAADSGGTALWVPEYQSRAGATSGAVGTVVTTFYNSVRKGSTILIVGQNIGTNNAWTGISDSQGNAYTLLAADNNGGTQVHLLVGIAKTSAAGSLTVTITSLGVAGAAVSLYELPTLIAAVPTIFSIPTGFPKGWFTYIQNTGTGTFSLVASGLTIDGSTASVSIGPSQGLLLVFDGFNWITERGISPVTSVFGRTGAIVATTGDYTAAQVTGAAPLASPTFTGTLTAPHIIASTDLQIAAGTVITGQSGTGGIIAMTASPAFTGTPTAPTAAPGTNTTQLASTAFVTAAVVAGVSGVTSLNSETGAVTLVAGSNVTITPAGTNITIASTGGVTFAKGSSYMSTAHNTTNAGWQKVPIDTNSYDTGSIWDNTNKRFTPAVAGYYQINSRARNGTAGAVLAAAIVLNGTYPGTGIGVGTDGTSSTFAVGGSGMLHFNGTTDYVELWAFSTVVAAYTNDAVSTYLQILGPF